MQGISISVGDASYTTPERGRGDGRRRRRRSRPRSAAPEASLKVGGAELAAGKDDDGYFFFKQRGLRRTDTGGRKAGLAGTARAQSSPSTCLHHAGLTRTYRPRRPCRQSCTGYAIARPRRRLVWLGRHEGRPRIIRKRGHAGPVGHCARARC